MYSTSNCQYKPDVDIQSPEKYSLGLSADDVSYTAYFLNKFIRFQILHQLSRNKVKNIIMFLLCAI